MEQRKTNHLSFRLMITLLALFSTHLCFSQKQETIKLIYKWAAPNQIQKNPAVLVIGGSEGELKYDSYWAELLNNKGFGVMSLAYFGFDGLSNKLVNRLKKKNYSYPVIFKNFTGAGHGFLIPYSTEEKKTSLFKVKDNISQKIQYLGGNVNAFGTAMTESLKIVLKELDILKNK